ncbi:GNAT family N-acetyltransferase [Oceanobacillus sp. FSL W8-0428]|uniref:GNAT family N-acetyltransferase n=1 Tax=unclassified Oceanobacillus TaxID=2630292 RepID=UPI0030D9306C
MDFIHFIVQEEKKKKQLSRVILNENKIIIGVITLKEIDLKKRTSHIGTWIGYPYRGKGYNQLAKEKMLYKAFTELDLEYVFAGAKISNIRSQKAQERIPYITIDVKREFPEEQRKLESQVQEACVLNVIEKNIFLDWYNNSN